MARGRIDGGTSSKPPAKGITKAPAPKPALAPAANPLQRLTTPPPAPKKTLVRKTAARSPAHTGKSTVPGPKPQTVKQAVAAVPVRQITSKPGGEPPAPARTPVARAKQNRVALRAQAKVIEKTNDKHNPLVPKLVRAGYLNVGPNDPLGLFTKTEHNHVFKGPKLLSKVEKDLLSSAASAGSLTPVAVKALDYVTRPAHAIAGAADAVVKGESAADVQRAAKAGLRGDTHILAGQVLKDAGVKSKLVQGIGGAAADIVLDPTTYVSFGAAGVAERAAARAARAGEKRALAAGMSADGAKLVARRAAQAAAEKAAPGRGLTVSWAGHEVPGVRVATGAVGKVLKKSKKVNSVAGVIKGNVKPIVRDFHPQLTPVGVDPAEHLAARQMARRARALTNNLLADSDSAVQGIRKKLGADDYRKVIATLESGKITKVGPNALSPKLADAARELRDHFRYSARLRARNGVSQGHIGGPAEAGAAQGYFPHALHEPLVEGHGAHSAIPEGVTLKKRSVKPSSAKERVDRRPLEVQNAERTRSGDSLFSTNVPLVRAAYDQQTARSVGRGQLEGDLAAGGREIKTRPVRAPDGSLVTKTVKGETSAVREIVGNSTIGPGEQVYHYADVNGRRKLTEVPSDQVGKNPNGQYVILRKSTVDNALTAGAPAVPTHTLLLFDRLTRGWKRVATGTLAFHLRNLVGDTQMAFLGQSGRRLPVNTLQAGKIIKRMASLDKAKRDLVHPPATSMTIKIAGKRVPVDDVIAGVRREGVSQSGQIGRELTDLANAAGGKRRLAESRIKPVRKLAGSKVGRAPRTATRSLARTAQNREALMRIATYKSGLDRGLSNADAAELSLGKHIDYGELSPHEREVMRRIAPFYTFTARSIPIHAKALVQTPGKFANIEKIIEEVAHSTGDDKEKAYKKLQDYQQELVPLIVGDKQVSDSPPLTSLNYLPDPAHLDKYPGQVARLAESLTNPLIKAPIELAANHSFLTGRPVQNPDKPRVAAPEWVRHLPKSLQKEVGAKMILDHQTGKKVLGWYGRADYLTHLVPGLVGQANQAASQGTNTRGQNLTQKLIGDLTGVKIAPIPKPAAVKVDALFNTFDRLTHAQRSLNQQGIYAENATPEYKRNAAQLKVLTKQITAASKKSGAKIPIFAKHAKAKSGLSAADQAALGGGAASLSPADKAALNGDSSALSAADKAALNGG